MPDEATTRRAVPRNEQIAAPGDVDGREQPKVRGQSVIEGPRHDRDAPAQGAFARGFEGFAVSARMFGEVLVRMAIGVQAGEREVDEDKQRGGAGRQDRHPGLAQDQKRRQQYRERDDIAPALASGDVKHPAEGQEHHDGHGPRGRNGNLSGV